MTFRKLVIASAILCLSLIACACARQPALPPLPFQNAPGEKLYRQAEMKFQSQDYSESIQLYQDYINIYPGSPLIPSALMKIGAIFIVQNRYAEARDTYQKLIETTPESQFKPDARLGILTTYYHEGAYEELLNQAQSMDDHSLPKGIYQRKYALLGDTYHIIGQPLQSVEAYLVVYVSTEDEDERQEIFFRMAKPAANLSTDEIQHFLPLINDGNLKGFFEYQLGVQYAQNAQYEDAVRQLTQFTISFPEHQNTSDARLLIETLMQMSEYDHTAIGCLLPLSGRYKAFGMKALKGIELALMQYSSSFPQADIRLVIRDTKGNPETTQMIVNELADQNIAAIIGPIINASEAATQAQARKIPIIAMTQKEEIADIGDYVFSNFLTPEMQMKTMVSFAVQHLGLHRFAILYPNEKYGTTFMNLFWDQVAALGGEIRGVESYEPDQADFTPSIKKLVGLYYEIPEDLKPKPQPDLFPDGSMPPEKSGDEKEEPKAIVDFDAIFIPDGPEKSGLILPQLTYYDVTEVYLIGTNLWHSDKLIQMAGRHTQGAIMPEIFFAKSSNPTVIQFVRSFTEAYGEEPGFIEAIAYDTARIMFQAVGSPNVQFRDSIKNRLLNLEDFQGVTGKTTFNQNGEAHKELFILQINGVTFSELSYE